MQRLNSGWRKKEKTCLFDFFMIYFIEEPIIIVINVIIIIVTNIVLIIISALCYLFGFN